jgi:predicted AAA+ superfamily ATPase
MACDKHEGRIMNPESKKLLSTLIKNPEREFNKKELAEEAEVSRDALYRRWESMEQLGVLEDTGSRYKLNQDNDTVSQLKAIINKIEN